MGYFVSNKRAGSWSNPGRGANPQLDGSPFLNSFVTPEIIESCRRKGNLRGIVSSNLTTPANH
jgi:hypothetical protein